MNIYFDRLPDRRVTVVGDLMLDRYLYGEVSRISPEAPVPLVRCVSEQMRPGGGANVAANLAAIGVSVDLVGVTGCDTARDFLLHALGEYRQIDTSGVLADPSRPTIEKLRILGLHQQIVRVDRETISGLPQKIEEALMESALAAIGRSDIIVLSDYGKGVLSDAVLSRIFSVAKLAAKLVLVDPKRRDWSAYSGAHIITPNRRELFEATGLRCETDEEAGAAAARASTLCGAEVLLTRSEKGISFFPRQGKPIHLATAAREIFDVSGAGDAVIAVLAAAMTAGMVIGEAIKLANHAAGIVVGKVGAATVTRHELEAMACNELAPGDIDDGRQLSLAEAIALRLFWAGQNLTVGFTNGCFDLLHPGHVSLLEQAAVACDRLIVAVNSDESVKRQKGAARPIQDENARTRVVGRLKGVSAVVVFTDDTPIEAIKALQPDVLVKGSDYALADIVGADLVVARGGKVILAELASGHSTTRLLEAVGSRDSGR
ncbi:MAG: D-glycero-beta-D-manno-heptose-7-phosphate kinase [Pseudomonadota bacterium]|nr:D-glycero-beta-D-manno-heptose-7-phosphate kinase [Pseudomonadota bacterium]